MMSRTTDVTARLPAGLRAATGVPGSTDFGELSSARTRVRGRLAEAMPVRFGKEKELC